MSLTSNDQTHLSSHSSGLSRLSARDRAEPPEGETHEPEDGQQVGERRGVHRRDAERGAGLPHARRPHQSPALTSVRLPSGGTTGPVHSSAWTDPGIGLVLVTRSHSITVHQQSHGERSSGI